MSSANENMLFIDGSKKKPASASVTPINMPPTSAPLMEPSPPTITMTKACKVKACASAGRASAMVTIRAPAAPTQASPIPKVSA
jgi:hypothetical protein